MEVQRIVLQARSLGETVGLVPTMGALHEGHLSLVDASLSECDRTVVSIFVNPTQFSPEEDLQQYPRPLEQDLELLEERGVWMAFVPSVEEMFPPGFDSYVDVGSVAEPLEGAARPTHFRGVATVVLKLFHLMPADRTFFGRKDYQQSLVIQQMIEDFQLPIEFRECPIVREADGLAKSSRNEYLTPSERKQSASLWRALRLAEDCYQLGENSVETIRRKMLDLFQSVGVDHVEYIAFLEEGTVREVATITGPTVVALAVRIGQTRLIDNHTLAPVAGEK